MQAPQPGQQVLPRGQHPQPRRVGVGDVQHLHLGHHLRRRGLGVEPTALPHQLRGMGRGGHHRRFLNHVLNHGIGLGLGESGLTRECIPLLGAEFHQRTQPLPPFLDGEPIEAGQARGGHGSVILLGGLFVGFAT